MDGQPGGHRGHAGAFAGRASPRMVPSSIQSTRAERPMNRAPRPTITLENVLVARPVSNPERQGPGLAGVCGQEARL